MNPATIHRQRFPNARQSTIRSIEKRHEMTQQLRREVRAKRFRRLLNRLWPLGRKVQ